jgi:capsule polysaccharide modification protein KpsS
MSKNGMIVGLLLMNTFSIAFFNSCGIACTKYASAAQRSTIDTTRTLTIWVMSCLLGLEPFYPLEIPGFILLASGTLLYNEIVVFPYWGFNENTKEAIAKRKGAEDRAGARLQDQDYIATSPHAAYDSKRNVRQLQKKMD